MHTVYTVQYLARLISYYPALRDYGSPKLDWEDGWHGCLGYENTPQEFVNHLVECFSHVKRVLRSDGILWVNIGDSYAKHNRWKDIGIKRKDLLGIPWAFAMAMRYDGWYLRSDCIFHKKDAMPKSCTDRCGEDHEYIFQFTKTDNYYFDPFALATNSSAIAAGTPSYFENSIE